MSQQYRLSKNNTSVRSENGDIIIRLHSTDIVRFNSERVILNSNGWTTATTKTRMNQAANQYGLNFHVWQRDHSWYVSTDGNGELDYFDGMEIKR